MTASGARLRWLPPALATLLVALAGALVYAGALGYFFSQDDYAGLARARGLLPRLDGPWRVLSGQTYFDLMGGIAGLDPRAYHLASLSAHLATAALLLAWLRPRISWPAALVGAVFFAGHPALYTAVYSVSGIGEILALLFALATLILARRRDLLAWLALPAFTLSLLSKESTLLLPVVAFLDAPPPPRDAGPASRAPRPVTVGLAAMALAYLAIFLTQDVFAVRQALASQAPYRLAFDATLLWNMLTYLGWAANFLFFTVAGFTDAVDPAVHPAGIALAALLAAGLFAAPLRRRGWLVGVAAFLAFLAPVLPLAHHTYHYYLYAPLAGLALCAGALADVMIGPLASARTPGGGARESERARERRRPKRAGAARSEPAPRGGSGAALAWIAGLAISALLVANGRMLVRKIELHPFVLPGLRADPTVDRARISGNVIADLRDSGIEPGARLLFWSPLANQLAREAGRDTTRETYYETNLRSAVMDGLAVRLFFPQVDTVLFVREYRPLGPRERYVIYRPDGRVRVVDEAGLRVLLSTLPRAGS